MSTAAPLTRRTLALTALALVLLVLAGAWASPGLVSSNDGSHLALARALALRHETPLREEVALTLWVDRAERDGNDYSDRPPGTALLAAPAVWLGAQLDPRFLRASEVSHAVTVRPAAPRYIHTYAIRVRRYQTGTARGPRLLALQGTSLLVGLHCALVGALGVAVAVALLRRRGVSLAAQGFAASSLALASLWGPYATVLFSHVTAGVFAIACVLALEAGAGGDAPARRVPLALAGVAAAWAFGADYLVALLVLGLGLATLPPRRLVAAAPWAVSGAAPVLVAISAYHAAAFGSPWSLGYDYNTNFAFVRARETTFDGNVLRGLWSQWGLGGGAGVLALALVMLVGVAGLAAHRERRWLVGALPWVLMLSVHHTPTGGAAADHRYIVPLMPVLAVGLGLAWSRWVDATPRGRAVGAALVALAAVSAALTWRHARAVWV